MLLKCQNNKSKTTILIKKYIYNNLANRQKNNVLELTRPASEKISASLKSKSNQFTSS